MNISNIEAKFEALDSRARRLSDYFSPVVKSGHKHKFITDLEQDFIEDSRMYGLNKYLSINQSPNSLSLPTEVSRISPNQNLTSEPVSSTDIYKKIIKTVKPRRKQVKIDAMSQHKESSSYKGLFSSTNLLPNTKRTSSLEPFHYKRNTESWADDIQSIPEVYSAMQLHLGHDLARTETSQEEISAEFIKQSFLEISKMSSKNQKYKIHSSSLDGSYRKRAASLPNDIQILYQTNTYIEIRAENGRYDVYIADIGRFIIKEYLGVQASNKFIQFKTGRKLNLSEEFEEVQGRVFQISIKGDIISKQFYICLSKYSYEVEENVIAAINKSRGIVNNQGLLERKLPKILENNDLKISKMKIPCSNPMTGALFKYKKTSNMFHPDAYLARLSSLESNAYISRRYSKKLNKFSYDHPFIRISPH